MERRRDVQPVERVKTDDAGAGRQIDARIERIFRRLRPIGEGPRPRHRDHATIRRQIAELRRLGEVGTPIDIGRTQRQSVRTGGPRQLRRRAPFALAGRGAVDQAVAFLVRLAVQQHVGDAAPAWKRGVRLRFAGGGDARIARRRQSGTLYRIGLVQRQPVRQLLRQRRIAVPAAIPCRVGVRVDARRLLREQPHLLQAVTVEVAVGDTARQRDIGAAIDPADLAEQLAGARGRIVAPSPFPEIISGGEPMPTLVPPADGRARDRAAETAIADVGGHARIGSAVLGADRQRPAQRIAPEQRIRPRHQRRRPDRGGGNQIPADHVAERLIHADAVEVDRQALRRAEQRRGGEAAIVDVRLQRVALHLVDEHAPGQSAQIVGQVQRMAARDLFVGHVLCGIADDILARIDQRRADDHQRLATVLRCGVKRLRRGRCCDQRGRSQ
ncbi:hypothetical protein WR25_07095 [Diploscapter pachys]|uniref:Uncharacterized protein n=1 Tax=Diploscapter pachys TaxID=2018661 RepID=A0A2A2M3D9_9BILA|nr:hypothetical protein WR25_07095 [Diploscapter pachys]